MKSRILCRRAFSTEGCRPSTISRVVLVFKFVNTNIGGEKISNSDPLLMVGLTKFKSVATSAKAKDTSSSSSASIDLCKDLNWTRTCEYNDQYLEIPRWTRVNLLTLSIRTAIALFSTSLNSAETLSIFGDRVDQA